MAIPLAIDTNSRSAEQTLMLVNTRRGTRTQKEAKLMAIRVHSSASNESPVNIRIFDYSILSIVKGYILGIELHASMGP